MDKPRPNIRQSSNHRPGEPLRKWGHGWPAEADLALAIQGADAGEALVRLINGEDLSTDDVIAFGRLNSLCVMRWYEPLVMLIGPKGPQITAEDADLVRRHTKLFRGNGESLLSASSDFASPLDQQFALFIDEHRRALHDCLDGLTETEARARLVPSKTTLLGLVKHAAFVEQVWFNEAVTGRSRAEIGCAAGPDESFDLSPGDTIESVRAAYRRVCAHSRAAVARLGPDDVVTGNRRGPLPMRWIYLHVLRELARHCGHADILREQLLAARNTGSGSWMY